jgi:RNA polymerase sigma-70 factor (ECF subfamily)
MVASRGVAVDQRELVERARRGDHDAFTELVGASIARLGAAARLILRDPDLARDAVQDAYLRAWRDLPGLRDPDRLDAWLHRLTVNACLDTIRRRRRRVIEVELTSMLPVSVTDDAVRIADRDQLERGFRRLSIDHRAVVVLHHYLDLPLEEVADVLGVPLGTVRSRLHRAMQGLRAALEADARPASREVVR